MYKTHIFLDFEMNPIPRDYAEERSQCRAELCEIGAVKLDERYQLVDRYQAFVKPHYGPITAKITSLTGITDEAVADAPEFEEAMHRFADWIGEEEPIRVYSWSMSDWYQIDDESYLKNVALPWQFGVRWMDFQAVYTRLIGLSGRNPLSLKYAIGAVESRFDGAQHRAVDDAENSAKLLQLVKEGKLKELAGSVYSALHPSGGTTMGDALKDQLAAWKARHE